MLKFTACFSFIANLKKTPWELWIVWVIPIPSSRFCIESIQSARMLKATSYSPTTVMQIGQTGLWIRIGLWRFPLYQLQSGEGVGQVYPPTYIITLLVFTDIFLPFALVQLWIKQDIYPYWRINFNDFSSQMYFESPLVFLPSVTDIAIVTASLAFTFIPQPLAQ